MRYYKSFSKKKKLKMFKIVKVMDDKPSFFKQPELNVDTMMVSVFVSDDTPMDEPLDDYLRIACRECSMTDEIEKQMREV